MGFPMSVYSDNDRAFQAGVKDFFEKEGITHVVTLTHANVVERFIRTMKNMIHDRVRFNRGSWTVMLSKALDKYNDTVPSKCDVRQRHLQQSQRGKEQSDEREIEIFSIKKFYKVLYIKMNIKEQKTELNKNRHLRKRPQGRYGSSLACYARHQQKTNRPFKQKCQLPERNARNARQKKKSV